MPGRGAAAGVAPVAFAAAALACPCHLLVYTPGAALADTARLVAGTVFGLALLALWWAAHRLTARTPAAYTRLGLSAEEALTWVSAAGSAGGRARVAAQPAGAWAGRPHPGRGETHVVRGAAA